jgi:hypothetical protein
VIQDYIWGGFDAMKVCTFKHNESPEQGSRPMSATLPVSYQAVELAQWF